LISSLGGKGGQNKEGEDKTRFMRIKGKKGRVQYSPLWTRRGDPDERDLKKSFYYEDHRENFKRKKKKVGN